MMNLKSRGYRFRVPDELPRRLLDNDITERGKLTHPNGSHAVRQSLLLRCAPICVEWSELSRHVARMEREVRGPGLGIWLGDGE